jgi:hypothetical protein
VEAALDIDRQDCDLAESLQKTNHSLRKGAFLVAVLLASVPVSPTIYAQMLGDVSDGSRAHPVHIINLYDEQGNKIARDNSRPMPFSTRKTCGTCHDYDTIAAGWHFNAADAYPNLTSEPPDRPGQPWILTDRSVATQVPLSHRPWPQALRPEQFGITPWQFLQLCGSHLPGGDIGELDSDEPAEIMRQMVSGKLEINCLACHNAHPGQDQAEFAGQIAKQNYRWATTAASELATVTGIAAAQDDMYDYQMSDAIATDYNPHIFGYRNRVLLDIVAKVPNHRCYFCHSNKDAGVGEKWATDEDVHLAAGLMCVDCHRNGLNHKITRNYEGESVASDNLLADALTCESCHLGEAPDVGRLGAPKPEHAGIPPIHFEKLTCTACHSGRWPTDTIHRTKTARAHRLGTHGVNRSDDALPHITYPVFANQQGVTESSGKIGPHKLIWPAYWATLKGEKVEPIELETVRQIVPEILPQEAAGDSGSWLPLTEKHIAAALKQISDEAKVEGQPVYITGGNLHRLSDAGTLICEPHPAAVPCLWPIAHNVRPAVQSLGVGGCEDCHRMDAPIFFGKVAVDSPLTHAKDASMPMIEFQNLDPLYTKAFALSFVFRPWLKATVILCSCGLAVVLLLYALRALVAVTTFFGGVTTASEQQAHSTPLPMLLQILKVLLCLGTVLSFVALAVTGFYPAIILRQHLSGYLLMLHVTAGGVFAACLTVLVIMSAHSHRFAARDWPWLEKYVLKLQSERFIVTSWTLVRKLSFWAVVFLALPLFLSVVASMFPLFGTKGQILLADTHRYTAYVFSVAAILYACLTSRKRAE